MRILFALPGLHRVQRGAEVAFASVATALAATGRDEVTMWGSGAPPAGINYHYRRSNVIGREHFLRAPKFPPLRNEFLYEEVQFAARMAASYRPDEFDATLTCSYPFTSWLLERRRHAGRRPAHLFVTQNGDFPAQSDEAEWRFFDCDGLICTNPDFLARNEARWRCALIPNGVDVERFQPGSGDRARFGIPDRAFVVLVVAALEPSKRVDAAIRSVAAVPDAFLVVAGDGSRRAELDALAAERLAGRYLNLTLPAAEMPDLYRSADALLHMSLYESFGNIYVEALASGLPIVANDFSVTRWVVGSGEGLVDAGDEAAVAAALTSIAQETDPAGRTAAGRTAAGVARARELFAWPAVAERYRAFIAELVEERGGPRP